MTGQVRQRIHVRWYPEIGTAGFVLFKLNAGD
jgi:hypothetical protein